MANYENIKGQGFHTNPERINKKGRPEGARSRSTIIREWLEADATDGEKGQVADQLTRALIKKAAAGDVSAFRELFDGSYGKVTDKVENTVSFTKMGSVKVGDQELSFNVGQEPNSVEDKKK